MTGLSPQVLAELVAELGPGSPLARGRRPPVSPPDNTPAQDLGRRDGSRALSPRAELVHLSGTEPAPTGARRRTRRLAPAVPPVGA